MYHFERIGWFSNAIRFAAQCLLYRRSITAWQGGRIQVWPHDMERDSFVLCHGSCATSESNVRNYKCFVGADVLADLLEKQHVRLVHELLSSPFRIRNIEILGNRTPSLPIQVDLMLVLGQVLSFRVRDAGE